jgi:gluconokinase
MRAAAASPSIADHIGAAHANHGATEKPQLERHDKLASASCRDTVIEKRSGMVIVVMGVSGCGKTTIGQSLAGAFGWDFQEGDALHPQVNIEKMSAGIPLNDDDRWPWLDRIASWIRSEHEQNRQGVVSCSALKRRYRDRLRLADADVGFVYIQVARGELERRTRQRHHFMPTSLLDSQLQTLEEPACDEDALTVSGEATLDALIAEVSVWLQARATR